MKKKKYILLTLILSLLSIDNVYAKCTDETKNEYEKIRNQYKTTTTFDSNSKTYTVRMENANTDKFRYSSAITAQYNCKTISDTITECYGLEPGKSFYVYTLSTTKDCDIILKEEEIYLKKLNKYYGDPLCAGIEEFVLCQEIYDRDIDRETFEYRIAKYKESEQAEKDKKDEEQAKENEPINKITSYIKNNPIQIIIIAIFTVLLIITIIIEIKSSKKSRRLE